MFYGCGIVNFLKSLSPFFPQECEMRVSPTELCGIQRDAGISRDWISYMEEVNDTPICTQGDAPGEKLFLFTPKEIICYFFFFFQDQIFS